MITPRLVAAVALVFLVATGALAESSGKGSSSKATPAAGKATGAAKPSPDDQAKKQLKLCNDKIKKAQELDVLYKIEAGSSGVTHVYVGPTFYSVPIDTKQSVLDYVDCWATNGRADKSSILVLHDSRTGKRIGKYEFGRLKLN